MQIHALLAKDPPAILIGDTEYPISPEQAAELEKRIKEPPFPPSMAAQPPEEADVPEHQQDEMTVGEVIAELQKYPANTPVHIGMGYSTEAVSEVYDGTERDEADGTIVTYAKIVISD